ncbi:MAG: hypothetical protein IJ371_06285 [Clostridia bacterium]|nr:hypothetical protein [Clostridia bacterium]
MQEQSLLELRNAINEYLIEKSLMDSVDRMELLVNINQFLEPKMYEENIKTLRMNDKRRNK